MYRAGCALLEIVTEPDLESGEEAKAFSDGDPFTQKGVFANITITRMRKGQWNPGAAEGA